jgi:hypothetical protein
MQIMDFRQRFQKGHKSASPFTTLGETWCPRCKMPVDSDEEAVHDGAVYAYKRTCKRCGISIAQGIYNNVPLLAPASPLMLRAVEWTHEPGTNRLTGKGR